MSCQQKYGASVGVRDAWRGLGGALRWHAEGGMIPLAGLPAGSDGRGGTGRERRSRSPPAPRRARKHDGWLEAQRDRRRKARQGARRARPDGRNDPAGCVSGTVGRGRSGWARRAKWRSLINATGSLRVARRGGEVRRARPARRSPIMETGAAAAQSRPPPPFKVLTSIRSGVRRSPPPPGLLLCKTPMSRSGGG